MSASYTARVNVRAYDCLRLGAKEIQGSRHVWLGALQSLFSCHWPSVAQQPCRSCRRAPAHCSRCFPAFLPRAPETLRHLALFAKSPACPSRCHPPPPHPPHYSTAGCWFGGIRAWNLYQMGSSTDHHGILPKWTKRSCDKYADKRRLFTEKFQAPPPRPKKPFETP